MKYWWLEKYYNFKIIQMKELQQDVNYFLTMPKNYEKQYLQLKEKDVNSLEEEELLIILKKLVNTKNIKDNSLSIIIEKLLQIPDNSFPASDYTLKEMLEEIKNLKMNPPLKTKLETNNIAICYHCLNIFYVDKIKSVNRNNLCLCPYCLKSKLYFDNDYIPMNYTFIKLASIYYKTSTLGCTFREVKKILNKNVKVIKGDKEDDDINLTDLLLNKIKPTDEKILNKEIYDLLLKKENNLEHKVKIYIKEINEDVEFKLLLLVVAFIDFLSNSIYLKEIQLVTNDSKIITKFKYLIKLLIMN